MQISGLEFFPLKVPPHMLAKQREETNTTSSLAITYSQEQTSILNDNLMF